MIQTRKPKEKRDLVVGQTWSGNNDKCQNLGGSKQIIATSMVGGKPHESRIVYINQHGSRTWSTHASFISWVNAYGARITRTEAVQTFPHIIIRKYCWDGWEAFCEECPLLRAKGTWPVEVFDAVMGQFPGQDLAGGKAAETQEERA